MVIGFIHDELNIIVVGVFFFMSRRGKSRLAFLLVLDSDLRWGLSLQLLSTCIVVKASGVVTRIAHKSVN